MTTTAPFGNKLDHRVGLVFWLTTATALASANRGLPSFTPLDRGGQKFGDTKGGI
jgi:hypothetical protein